MPEPVVRLTDVHRTFGDVVALGGFSLDVPAGTIAMLLGPNGAGKTTVVRIVTGALPADHGEVRVFGLDPRRDGGSVRERCGVVPARPALYDRLTGRDNLEFAARLFGVADGERAATRAAARFAIDHALDQRVGGYSTGMRARLALARATLHDPELLLLDEPTAGLDPESARAVLALIADMAGRGNTVLMCTHLLLEAEGLADHVMVMDTGRTIVSGHPRDLTRRYWTTPTVLVEADPGPALDVAQTFACVTAFHRDGATALVGVETPESIPDLVTGLVARGVRLRRVEPRQPTLEELYFAVRREHRASPGWRPPAAGEVPLLPPVPAGSDPADGP